MISYFFVASIGAVVSWCRYVPATLCPLTLPLLLIESSGGLWMLFFARRSTSLACSRWLQDIAPFPYKGYEKIRINSSTLPHSRTLLAGRSLKYDSARPSSVSSPSPHLYNPSCSLQTLNSKGQHEPDDLQLKPSRRDRMDLLRKQLGYAAEDRLYVLANRLTQELLPRRHRSLGVLPAL